jgi:hypothetical protein
MERAPCRKIGLAAAQHPCEPGEGACGGGGCRFVPCRRSVSHFLASVFPVGAAAGRADPLARKIDRCCTCTIPGGAMLPCSMDISRRCPSEGESAPRCRFFRRAGAAASCLGPPRARSESRRARQGAGGRSWRFRGKRFSGRCQAWPCRRAAP